MRKLSQWLLHLSGWRITGKLPTDRKYLIIAAPHTSNWDLIICLLARFAVGVRVKFLAKHQLFTFPLNLFLKAVGGTPVNRSQHNRMVEQVAAVFEQNEDFILGIAPEGTRSEVKRWKQGFYHIACRTKIPIVMLGLDFSTKQLRLSQPFWPSGNITEDFPIILDYFRAMKGRYPKKIPYFSDNSSEN